MYTLRVEQKDFKVSELVPGPGDGEELSELFTTVPDGLDAVEFSAGNPRVEHITGIVHLYKRNQPTADQHGGAAPGQLTYAQAASTTAASARQRPASSSALLAPQRPPPPAPSTASSDADAAVHRGPDELARSTTLCCLAIPSDMSVAQFCTFCGAYLAQLKAIKVLRREGVRGQGLCMVLLSFAEQQQADSFMADFNGMPFSSLEPEILCRLVHVRSVEVVSGGSAVISAEPPPGHTELPTCPVCLERLDEHISGVVVTVCNHRFHGECLKRWGDTSCPVCRYCMLASPPSTSRCATCGTGSNLWICLICGHVGCGRYRSGHASDHWKESSHCYALELETQRVWDYAGDGYVHRLIQSKTDGKLVEVPSPAPARGYGCASPSLGQHGREGGASGACGDGGAGASGSGVGGGCPHCEEGDELKQALLASKLDAIAAEYNHLLVSQLDSQRQYFEGLLAAAAAESDARAAAACDAEAATATSAAVAEAREAERRRQLAERRLAELMASSSRLAEEKEFLRSLNETLLANQKEFKGALGKLQSEVAEKDATIQDLQEQVRDLMVYIEAQRTIQESGEELAGGTVGVVPVVGRGGRRRGGKR